MSLADKIFVDMCKDILYTADFITVAGNAVKSEVFTHTYQIRIG